MRPLDWVVFFAWVLSLVSFGLYRGRGSNTVDKFLRAGKSMPWYAMGLSIIATQASAITFISTTGQGYVDGMRFVEFYFGLPIAMVILSATAVPIFHRANVYTAYEYLERRFDAKTRALVGLIFLIQRGLACGIGLYAPAVALSDVLGWPDRLVTVVIGALVVLYVTSGGIKGLTWADVQQMAMIFVALIVSMVLMIQALPHSISLLDAVHLAGAAGRMNIVDTHLNWADRYNLWSGLIGGAFLALAYFGCDQSQVQRYLTGKSIAQSRLSLMLTAVVKIPMQLFILFIGVVVFALSLFIAPPMLFQPLVAKRAAQTAQWAPIHKQYDAAFAKRRQASYQLAAAARQGGASLPPAVATFRHAETDFHQARLRALHLVSQLNGGSAYNDTNYIFLSFIRTYLPIGLLGLVVGVIFSASMGSSSGEINSLATVSMVDIYRRFLVRNGSDRHYLIASRCLTVFWGAYAVAFAAIGARGFGALIVRVNIVGSLFYGSLLGVFVLAFLFRFVRGNAAFWGVVVGEAGVLVVAAFTKVSFLWYNVVGCVLVVGVGLALSRVQPSGKDATQLDNRSGMR
ncbi:MAG TPA: sodium:solute symporter [Bryobacteraceae bacterium]